MVHFFKQLLLITLFYVQNSKFKHCHSNYTNNKFIMAPRHCQVRLHRLELLCCWLLVPGAQPATTATYTQLYCSVLRPLRRHRPAGIVQSYYHYILYININQSGLRAQKLYSFTLLSSRLYRNFALNYDIKRNKCSYIAPKQYQTIYKKYI